MEKKCILVLKRLKTDIIKNKCFHQTDLLSCLFSKLITNNDYNTCYESVEKLLNLINSINYNKKVIEVKNKSEITEVIFEDKIFPLSEIYFFNKLIFL